MFQNVENASEYAQNVSAPVATDCNMSAKSGGDSGFGAEGRCTYNVGSFSAFAADNAACTTTGRCSRAARSAAAIWHDGHSDIEADT